MGARETADGPPSLLKPSREPGPHLDAEGAELPVAVANDLHELARQLDLGLDDVLRPPTAPPPLSDSPPIPDNVGRTFQTGWLLTKQ